jgi:hypothetical protein
VAALLGILFVYELFDLWASPWLTAWVIVAYFAAAFVLEALFTRDSFCMYLCPLGTFNFLYSTVSPFQIASRNLDTCRTCPGKECINGRWDSHDILLQQGCQLELYVPTLKSNLDCTLCLDCAKACPYDNVALAARPPGDELFRQSWPHRLDLALLAVLAACAGLVNAFAMTPPVYALEQGLARWLRTNQEWVVLGLLFLVGVVLIPVALVYGAALLNRLTIAANRTLPLSRLVMRYAYGFVPLGFGVWAAHYLFHLLVGPLTILPAFQTFFWEVAALRFLGEPNAALAAAWVPSLRLVQAVQMVAMGAGLAMALAVAWRAARRSRSNAWAALVEVAPWALILLLLAWIGITVFLLPMEMRGGALG